MSAPFVSAGPLSLHVGAARSYIDTNSSRRPAGLPWSSGEVAQVISQLIPIFHGFSVSPLLHFFRSIHVLATSHIAHRCLGAVSSIPVAASMIFVPMLMKM
jgi:hypothetical protein